MRLLTSVVSVLLLTACGSGSPTDTKPVPVVLVPATVIVSAGAGQQAVPGANVTIKPIVTVKDASGQPVPGTSVGFAIDSGGGSLQSASATTASDGTASPGDWTMGPTEARNVLRVTVGALPAVRILALGAVAPVTIADQTVGSGGGTIAVTTAGSPITGLKIVVPAGAFAGGQTVGITYGSALGVTVPAGVRIISPLVTFRTSDGGLAATPMQITIPATVPTGSHPAILLRDAASGRQALMTTVAWSATSVTGMSAHLNGALLMGADGSFSPRSTKRQDAPAFGVAGGTGTAVVVSLPEELLALDHDTGFRPGVDSWEFRPIGTVVATNINPALIASEAWYYMAKKASNGSLWKKYQEADGIEESNRRGLRWVSVAQGEIGTQLASGFQAIANVSFSIPVTGRPLFTTGQFNSVRGALTLAPGSPQPALLSSFDASVEPQPILVYRSTGQKLFAVNPGAPDQTVVLDFTSGVLAPVTLGGGGPQYTNFLGGGFTLLATMAALQSEWPAVADGTIGSGIFPTYQARMGWGSTAAETADLSAPVYVFGDATSPTAVWADCVTCIGNPRPAGFPPGPAQVASLAGWARASASGPWTDLGVGGRLLLANPYNAVGLGVFTYPSGSANKEWTDWISFPTAKLPATIAPAAPTAAPNTDLTLTLTVTGAPGNLEYVWDFADGTAPATTTVANVTHKWDVVGTYVTKVTARDKTTKQPVAQANASVTVGASIYVAWKITTKNTTLINDTRLVDTRTAAQGNLWLNAVLEHGANSIYSFLWRAYQADSTFLYGPQSTNAAIALIARDTLLGPPFAATTGFHRGIYWWEYGSYPTSGTTPLSPGLIGSSNSLIRGGTSCAPAYSARFSQTGNTTSGSVTGLNWVTRLSGEPLVLFDYDVTINGETATGTTTKTYRLASTCSTPEVTWSYRTTFTAVRIR